MCGRFTVKATSAELVAMYRLTMDDGAVLRTVVPASAILLVRKREDYYDEEEVVVDPYKLAKIEIIERLSAAEISGS
jgi:hypothetical protein